MNSHLVSIVIPHHSTSALFKKTLRSCLNQTYKTFEVLVIDDGSPPRELNAIEKLLTDSRCRLVKSATQRGPSHARNIGFELSRGEFIQFLDSDDFIHPRKLELQVESLLRNGTQWVGSDWRIVFKLAGLSFPFPVIKGFSDQKKLLLGTISEKAWFPVMSCLFRKSFLTEMGPWLENDFVEDREFRLRMLIKSTAISHVNQCLFHYNRYSFISRRVQISFNREAWNEFVMSNQRFITQMERELMVDCIPQQEFLNELEAIRKRLPLEVSAFSPQSMKKRQVTRQLANYFLKSFFRNWVKQFRSYLSLSEKFQMTGGDL